MIFRLLGQVEALQNGKPLALGAPKQRTVLAALLLEPGTPASTAQLCDGVWGAQPPVAARKSVQVYVSNLRRILASLPGVDIVSDRDSYRIDVDPDEIDLFRFRRLAAEAAAAPPEQARELWHAATELWRGPVLSGLGDCELRERYAGALHEECLSAYERRVAADLQAGQAAELVPTLLGLAGGNPFRETVHALLMTALYRSGRRAEALGVFRDLRARMVDELGSEPGPEVFAIHQELLEAEPDVGETGEQAPGDDPADRPMVRARPAQLPPAVAHFAGRRSTLERVTATLTAPSDVLPVVALTGPGGAGKTALAIRAAHSLRDRFADGQLFANLRGSGTSPAEPVDVLAAFLRALGVREQDIPADLDDRMALFRTTLSGRRVLVVLDDAADATQVRPLLPGDERCGVVVTARSRLYLLDGVASIEVSEFTAGEAHQLLASVVGADRIAAEPDATNEIIQACGRLPLALRIAGSRLALQPGRSVADFARRLASTRVLDELDVGAGGVRSSLDLSYEQLDPAASRAFRLLSLPEVASLRPPTMASILDVGIEHAERLARALVDLHLLTEVAPNRYRYHDLLRVYARERAAATDPMEERVGAVRRAFNQLAGSAVYAVRSMMPALRAQNPRLGESAWVQRFSGSESAQEWLAEEHVNVTTLGLHVLQLDQPPLAEMAQLVNLLGNYAEASGYWPGWETLSARVLQLAVAAGDRQAQALIRLCLGGYALRQRHSCAAIEHLTAFVDYYRGTEEHTRLGRGLTMLALAYVEANAHDDALRCFDEALAAHERGGNRRSYAVTLGHMSKLFLHDGDPERAYEHAWHAWQIWNELGADDAYLATDVHKYVGMASAALGRPEQAVDYGEASLRFGESVGYTLGRRATLAALARAHRDAGDLACAATRFEQALAEPHDPREVESEAIAAATLRRELADVLVRMGRVEHAEASMRRS